MTAHPQPEQHAPHEQHEHYERDGAAIYRRSFAIIRAEADLTGVPADLEPAVVRMIHACGMTDLPDDLAWSPGFGPPPGPALAGGGADPLRLRRWWPTGITRSRLPAGNEVVCTLREARGARAGGPAGHHQVGGGGRALARAS